MEQVRFLTRPMILL